MIDNRNMILAVVLSIAILVGFEMFFSKDRPTPPADGQAQSQQALKAPPSNGVPTLPSTAPGTGAEILLQAAFQAYQLGAMELAERVKD